MKVERLQQSGFPPAVCVGLNLNFFLFGLYYFIMFSSLFVSKVHILSLSNRVPGLWIQAWTPLTVPVKQIQFPEYNRRSGLSLITAE